MQYSLESSPVKSAEQLYSITAEVRITHTTSQLSFFHPSPFFPSCILLSHSVYLCVSVSFQGAESESLESRLACVGVLVLPECVEPVWCSVCVLLLRLSSDCRKERLALSSSSGEAPSSSTSAISAKVTG